MCAVNDAERAACTPGHASDFGGAKGSGRIARHDWRPGRTHAASFALFVSGPVLPETNTGAIHSQDRRDFTFRNPCRYSSDVIGVGEINMHSAICLSEVMK